MIIEVTQEDIDNGGCHGDTCPIARAIVRKTGLVFSGLYVGRRTVDMGEEQFDLPGEARAFIDWFDNGGWRDDETESPPQPFSFPLPIDHLICAGGA